MSDKISGEPQVGSRLAGSVFIVFYAWDDMDPASWDIKAVCGTIQAANDVVEKAPKTPEETGFEPMMYKIEEWPVTPNAVLSGAATNHNNYRTLNRVHWS